MTRPDLDKYEQNLVAYAQRGVRCGINLEIKFGKLLTYCRELEAENKWLREEGAGDAQRRANWLKAAGDCGP